MQATYIPPTRDEQIVIAHLDGAFSAQRKTTPIAACARLATEEESANYWAWVDSMDYED